MNTTLAAVSKTGIAAAAATTGLGRGNVTKPTRPQQFGEIQVSLPTNDIYPDDFVITCDNSGGGSNVTYRVGDPTGAHTIYYGGSPTAASYNYTGLTNTTINNWMLAGLQFRMTGLNLTTTDDADQFNQAFNVVSGIYNGFTTKNIMPYLNEAENPMAQNPNLLKPVFPSGLYLPLDVNNSWFIVVLAGQKLTIKVKIGKAGDVFTQSLTSVI